MAVSGGTKMKTKLLTLSGPAVVDVTEDMVFVLDFSQIKNKEAEVDNNIVFKFTTPGVTAEIIGLYHLAKDETLTFGTEAVHRCPNTSCNTKIRGALQSGTSSDYLGKIKIEKKAQQTSSFLHDSVLVIGDNVHNRADPVLEIEANEVSASHGATTGRIDKDQLYYLQSRGLSLNESERLILQGFFETLLGSISDAKVKKFMSQQLSI